MKIASPEYSNTKNPSFVDGARSKKYALRGGMMGNNITDDEFARMVAEEVKNKLSPVHRNMLLNKENWSRWRDALVSLSDNLQAQIENIEADAEADEERFSSMGRDGSRLSKNASTHYDAKATRVRRFKFHVDKRLDEVSVMIDTGSEMKTDGWEKVEFLRRSIAHHRKLMREYDLEDTAIDRALWAALDEEWLFDSINENNL